MMEMVGYWIAVFLTLCILSFLYKDNPFYKLAEHLFVGVSVGYVITQQYYNTIRPNLVDRLLDTSGHWYVYLIPLFLVVLLFAKAASRQLAWLGRYPIAFVVALYAGIQINAVAQADLAEQVKISTQPVVVPKTNVNTASVEQLTLLPGVSPPVAKAIVAAREAGTSFSSLDDLERVPGLTEAQIADLQSERGRFAGLDAQASVRDGDKYWFGIFSRLLMIIGLLSALVYFYFSIEQKGAVARVSRFGVWILMIGFGAAFGYTVQGRLALAVGRAMDLLDKERNGPVVSLVCLALIVGGLVVWEVRQKNKAGASEQTRS